ncbi:uncharacterized protein PHACADRAFT_257843 [Phanerochaete carnosa HHB-10118-sp]|uniref:Uncharacterized protein n=1 Tax=Phanerochaete carnosa (strain HHB-10118-sp) TaxID=650164 RepID=K5W4V8_PHACS|nr:uncharacterized protein PHACADRAFT_257843 [Phanerochaete carnosa HHB-10118-sp]EKM54180.1 hypothetical protein PHACADRAFT_257843 [Phanerochaete carnosa HHB-10118-sp]
MIRAQASRTLAAATRATPAVARVAAAPHARTYATIPDPQHPTDGPKPNDKPTPSAGGGNTFAMLTVGTAALIGGWWYLQQKEDPHAKRLEDQAALEKKAQEMKEAGKATAHDAARESKENYEATKVAAKDKLNQARTEAGSAAADVRGRLESVKSSTVQTYDSARNAAAATVNDATRKAEATYDEARKKAADAAHKVEAETQSWGQWLGSWFGYGKAKTEKTAEDAKREAARQVAAGADRVENAADKVENEARKRA